MPETDRPSERETLEPLDRARRGSEGGFAELHGRYGKRLRVFVAWWVETHVDGRMRGRFDSEDVVQEALLQAHQDLARFEDRGAGSFFRWLCTLAVHRAQDAVRRHRAAKCDVAAEAPALSETESCAARPLPAKGTSPSRRLAQIELQRALGRAIARLPESRALVIRERFLNERTLREVAESLGVGTTRVFQLQADALVQLREELSRIGGWSLLAVGSGG
jgi:RNA polymerase sigma-70 factor (ECF subfamily)